MAQHDFGTINPTTTSGTALAGELDDFRDAMNTKHSGTTRPSYVVAGMEWINTAGSTWIVNMFDGTNDIAIGYYQPSTGRYWNPTLRVNNEYSVASASTVNLAAATSPQVSITGTTQINSLGAAEPNLIRFVSFTGILTLKNNSNIICPGGADIVTQAGDRMTAISNNSGNWQIYGYQRADGRALNSPVLPSIQTLLDGIGNTVGSLLYRSSGGWLVLAPGTAGQILKIVSSLPAWANNVSLTGAVTSYTSSGTWSKPSDMDDYELFFWEALGSGGGGTSTRAGGGGSSSGLIPYLGRDMASTMPLVVPAGGAINAAGGDAYVGSANNARAWAWGAAGGAGTTNAGGTSYNELGGAQSGGNNLPGNNGGFNSGGGGAAGSVASSKGGDAHRGGGGGGYGTGAGGNSDTAGNGGGNGVAAGVAGGGQNAQPGGRGEIRMYRMRN